MDGTLIAEHSSPGLLLEFVGVPGVGKSTVSHAVADILRAAGIPCSEPTYEIDHGRSSSERTKRKLKLAGFGTIRRSERVAPWLGAIGASGQGSLSEAAKATLNWCYLIETARRAALLPGVHVFDQGLCQAWWSLEYGALTPRGLPHELARKLFLPPEGFTVVVALRASVAAALERLGGRTGGASRVDRDLRIARSPDPAVHAASVFEELVEAVTGISAAGSLRLISVDNERSDDIAATALTIAALIEEEYRSRAGSPSIRRGAPVRSGYPASA